MVSGRARIRKLTIKFHKGFIVMIKRKVSTFLGHHGPNVLE